MVDLGSALGKVAYLFCIFLFEYDELKGVPKKFPSDYQTLTLSFSKYLNDKVLVS